MARLNKFASVNLNDSYGKPDRAGSANSNSSSSPSSSGKPRISSSGGMLILSRPGRSQPPSPKPGQARLGIPSPVNLPSLKRENSAGDPLPASPPHTGWTKGESPPLPGWTKGESPIEISHLQQKAGLSRSLDTVGETLKTMASGGKPDVYAPPALRAMQAATTTPRPLPPTPPLEKPPAVIRGEEFPTLQAAVARPPTPPQHPRQRDLQQKQREKHQESKEQQIRLQQLSHTQVQKETHGNSYQAGSGNASQPSLSLRPLGKQQVTHKVNAEASGLDPSLHSSPANNRSGMQGPTAYTDGTFSISSPAGVRNQGDTALSRSPPVPSQSVIGKADDPREAAHSFRPQYRNPLPSHQGSPSIDTRQSGFLTGSDPSWFSSSRREFTSPSKNGDHPKFGGNMMTNAMEDSGRNSSEFRSASFGRESYYGKDTSFFREGSSGGIGREDSHVQAEGFGREISDARFNSRSSALVHDGVPRIEGFYSQRSFGRETYNRESREVSNRMVRENMDAFQRDIRDSRENYSRDMGDAYERDVREAYHRDPRNVYTRDVREVNNQEIPMNKHVGYGNSSVNNGDNLWRGSFSSSTESPHGRGGVHSPGIVPPFNPGPEQETPYGRRYGPQGFGDQYSTREGRSNQDSRVSRGMYVESTAPYGSAETRGSRSIRSPAPGNGFLDAVKEVHEIRYEKPQQAFDEDRQIKFEDKGVDTKVSSGHDPRGSSLSVQRPYLKRESSQGSATRIAQLNSTKNVDDETSSRQDLKKQLMLEDERRKEAAKLKLLELEERIARRAVEEGRKDEIGSESKDRLEAAAPKQQEVEQVLGNFRFELNNMGAQLPDRDIDIEEDLSSRVARPSSASSTSSWNYKSPSEGLVAQEQDFRLVSESELNQDRKVVRSRSPGSWRKDVGGGPTSKLFSSPYVESGGLRRPSDGGTYKLF